VTVAPTAWNSTPMSSPTSTTHPSSAHRYLPRRRPRPPTHASCSSSSPRDTCTTSRRCSPSWPATSSSKLRVKAALLTQRSLAQSFPAAHQRQPFPVCVWSKGTARADAALMHYSLDCMRSPALIAAATSVRQNPSRGGSMSASGSSTANRGDVKSTNSSSAIDSKAETASSQATEEDGAMLRHGCMRVVCAQPQALETTGLFVRFDPPFTQIFPKKMTHTHCTCRLPGAISSTDGRSKGTPSSKTSPTATLFLPLSRNPRSRASTTPTHRVAVCVSASPQSRCEWAGSPLKIMSWSRSPSKCVMLSRRGKQRLSVVENA